VVHWPVLIVYMVKTRQQVLEQEQANQKQVSQELERLSAIEIEQTNNLQEQQHIVYQSILSTMADKINKTIAANTVEKLPKFSGRSDENVKKWVIVITNEFNLIQFDDKQKFALIHVILLDDARRWFINNMCDIKDWSTFVIQIQETFESTIHQELAIRKVGSRQQGISETVMQYYNDMVELFDMIDSDMNDELKVAYLKTGIKVSLKKDVMRKDPKNPVQFLKVAQEEEKLDSSIFIQTDDTHQSTINSFSRTKSSPRPYSAQQQYQQQPQYQQQSQNQQQQYQPQPQNQQQEYQQNQQQRQYQQQEQQPWQSSIRARCYRCNKEGHFARDCFSKNY
jgi:hypothetical protein